MSALIVDMSEGGSESKIGDKVALLRLQEEKAASLRQELALEEQIVDLVAKLDAVAVRKAEIDHTHDSLNAKLASVNAQHGEQCKLVEEIIHQDKGPEAILRTPNFIAATGHFSATE